MVNDEVNNKAINIEIKVAQYSAKAILKAIDYLIEIYELLQSRLSGFHCCCYSIIFCCIRR